MRDARAIEDTRLEEDGLLLRPIRREELGLYARWWSDPEVAWGFCTGGRSEADLRAAFPELEAEARDAGHWQDFVLEVRKPVGLLWLSRWDLERHECEMNILIGEAGFRRRGLARRAIRLLARWAFQRMDLRRILLCPREDHLPAIRCYLAAGAVMGPIREEVATWAGETVCFREMALFRETAGGADPIPGGCA